MGSRMRRLAALGAFAAVVRALSRFDAVRVAGDSMQPTLRDGELLAVRPLGNDEPHPGQIVVARVGDREVVKRVTRPAMEGEVWLEGDNPERSTDSRTTGPVPRDAVVGIVRARVTPLRRARLF